MITDGKNYPSAAALALGRAWQRLTEKHQDADSATPAADLEARASEPIRQGEPEVPTNEAGKGEPEVPTNEACRRDPMKTADEYRTKAEDCEGMARDGDADLRALYLVQAAHWRFLAEQADQFEAQIQKRKILDTPPEQ